MNTETEATNTTRSEVPAPRPGRTTVKEIIKACGGAAAIVEASAAAAAASGGESVSIDAVYKWPKIGILDRHWPVVMKLCDATADELYQANCVARGVEAR